MIDLETFTTRYYASLRGIVQALPKGAAIPPFLSEPSFVIGCSDVEGKFGIEILSRANSLTVLMNGKVMRPESDHKPGLLYIKDALKIEDVLFPHDNEGTSVSVTIEARHAVLDGLSFSSKQYNDKYWANATFYRNTAGDNPFAVTKNGSMLGLNLLWGAELDGARQEKLLEYVKLFGSEEVIPSSDAELQDETFRDFGHAAVKLGDELDAWSFTKFLRTLKTPVERNVLLLGSYESENDLEELRAILTKIGYYGFLLKDSPDLPIQSNLEKLFTAIICSCFIIVLDYKASAHLAELQTMLQYGFRPVIVLRATPEPTTAFLEDQIFTDDNFRVVIEPNVTASRLLPHILWAKEVLASKEQNYNAINHWRGR